ncbi:MAG: BamA/TamA family outer membrane protein [Gemmatimonadaceae bacterium]|nr:BamA/TamA family outer membrane protein [Gemmatimonadaceae bacterium]
MCLACPGPLALHAQRACDPAEAEVRSLVFVGNKAFASSQLAGVIALTASDAARRVALIGDVLGAVVRCGNPALVSIDRARLVIYYRRRGFPDVQVDTLVQRAARTMDLKFVIREGRATTIDTLRVVGVERIAERDRIVRGLPIARGQPFDQYLLEQSRDTLRRRLADVGFPFAQVLLATDVMAGTAPDTTRRTAVVEFSVRPGPLVTIDKVLVQVVPREGRAQEIPSDVVRSLIGLTPGQRFQQSDVERATRALYLTDAYQQVRIEPRLRDSVSSLADSARVDVMVNIAERFMHSRTLSAGFGTLDCFRTQLQYTDRNLLSRARRLEVTGRLSKIGIGRPVDFEGADGLCSAVANGKDPYSDRLNYYVGATLRPPVGPGGLRIPEFTLYSEVRGEYQAYRRTTSIGAIASVTLQAARRLPVTLAYDLSFGRTEAQPALFCSVLNRCAPEDRRVFETTRRLAVLGANFSRDRTDDPINPRNGSFTRLAIRHASSLTLSDSAFKFSSAVLDASKFWGLAFGATLAVRLQLGAVFGSSDRLVPPQERLYAGGPTTVRGFRQNELGPVAYVVSPDTTVIAQPFIRRALPGDSIFTYEVNPAVQPFRVVPVGGNTVAVGNVELRLRSPFLPNLLQWNLFADFGQVWSRGGNDASLRNSTLRTTPGVGARIYSPIGVIRLDVGYNNYAPRAGAAYFNELPRANGDQALLCVSPGNTIVAREITETVQDGNTTRTITRIVQDAYGSCRGSYSPNRNRGALGPFTFFFAIGQAF